MSYAPFDGVLLDDLRPPIPGAMAMLLHVLVAEILGHPLNLDAIEARAGACRDLLAHGLLPAILRGLSNHGLDLGSSKAAHSMNSVMDHLEHYLKAVSSAGYIEPNAALWEAVDKELNGGRGLWCERSLQDGPLGATLKDLQPARLRALACLPHLGGAIFRLATSRGGNASGLFGSGQPLADWFLDGLETHGQAFTADIQLAEPTGWGEVPWADTLDSLFEGTLDLEGCTSFQRGLVESPFDLVRHAVEQIVTWVNQGINPQDITLIHPKPEKIQRFIKILLDAEGVPLNSSGLLHPLIQSGIWSPIWSFLQGLSHLDPRAVATGLHSSKRPEIRAWAERLSVQDQTGQKSFEACIDNLPESSRPIIKNIWQSLLDIRSSKKYPSEWSEALNDLITSDIRFPLDSDDFYAPMGLIKECWGGTLFSATASKKTRDFAWDFDRMLDSLRVFLESARSAKEPSASNGVRLISPSGLLDDWNGAEATLILDLSEGTWPAVPISNPDLDWTRRAAINTALVKASENQTGFPPALQRFWLPKAEYGTQIPRAFQRDAYAFNKVLAMTRQHLVALSPAQDGSGRNLAQGAFWTAIEGAVQWEPDTKTCASNLRWAWDGFHRTELADKRSNSAQALGSEALFESGAPAEDYLPELRPILQNQKSYISPTMLESLARCPFRAIVEHVWHIDTDDTTSLENRSAGKIVHALLHTLLRPFLDIPRWPEVFPDYYNLLDTEVVTLENLVNACWHDNQNVWLAADKRLNPDQISRLRQQTESLLPNIAAYISNDLEDICPTIPELHFLFPDKIPVTTKSGSNHYLRNGWQRTIMGLEEKIGPIALPIPDEQAMSVAGIVDRLELWENPTENISFIRVIDYKTSFRYRLNDYAASDAPISTHLQTPLYIWMVAESHNRRTTSVLVPLRDDFPRPFANHLKFLAEISSDTSSWQSALAQTLARLNMRIEQGDFPPTPGDNCKYCKYAALCMRPVDITVLDDANEDE